MAKKKRTFTSIEVIQRQFRRRIWRDIHIGVFAASQLAIWLWWLTDGIRTGRSFDAGFFTDRLIVLVAWGVLLMTHLWVTRLLNERDRQIGEMMEGELPGHKPEVEEERPVVFARRLEEKFSDEAMDILSDDPRRNENHR